MEDKINGISPTLITGSITEISSMLYFMKHGYVVSVPQMPCLYDFLIDVDGLILRIQVKTCKEKNGKIEFNTSSTTHNSKGYTRRVYDSDAFDYFCTFYNETCYLVPLCECGTRAKSLRISEARSYNKKNICLAENYIADKILNKIKDNMCTRGLNSTVRVPGLYPVGSGFESLSPYQVEDWSNDVK